MTKEERLQKVIKDWEAKGEALFQEANIARKHNYPLEAMKLDEQYRLVRDFCMDIKMKVIEGIGSC